MTELRVELGKRSYGITVGQGLLDRAGEYFKFDGRALIITDDGVPAEYARRVAAAVKGESEIITVEQGEGAKSLAVLEDVLNKMTEMKLSRSDCVIGVGGGVVGDLSGFAAAVYMRGIDFYNVPTTLLAMVDSSIGGKTAVNLGGIKNIVGAFHQPSGVLIDTDTLATLDGRLRASGLCEAVKMAATSNAELFEYFEMTDADEIYKNIEWVIAEALRIKKAVVEKDECEAGLRKILNFGHTLGHGIEAERGGSLYHGECVGLGMLPLCSEGVRVRLLSILDKLGLPTEYTGDVNAALEFAAHDKKASGKGIDVILVDLIGSFKIERMSVEGLADLVTKTFK